MSLVKNGMGYISVFGYVELLEFCDFLVIFEIDFGVVSMV